MHQVRGELAAILKEAKVILKRERSKGRIRIQAAAPEETADANPRESTREIDSAPPLALPGFESFLSNPSSSPPLTATLYLRVDLPADLGSLSRAVATCRSCGLCQTRTNTVFADGSASARLVFVGEAPGRDEDAQGLPFVGRAGQLLNKMIAAIEMKREDVYICNVLKCRPPDNRVPAPDEVEQCRPFLEQQIALVRPALICALGLSATQALLQTKASMSSMRGKTFSFRGVPVIPTYHPAALLRNPGLKREAWVDLQRVRDFLRQLPAA